MNKTPEVGDGVTKCVGSDMYPYTVVEVSPNGRNVKVQADNAVNTVTWPDQDWAYTRNPDASKVLLTLRNDGEYREAGTLKSPGTRWVMGARNKYSDPSF